MPSMSQAQAQPPKQSQAPAQPPKPKTKRLHLRGELYDLSGSVAKLRNRKCPRCGSVMATHSKPVQRWVCGSCSFTDYGQK